MAHALGFRPVDHANRTLQPLLPQEPDGFAAGSEIEKETFLVELRKNFFVTARERFTNGFRFSRSIPVGRCCHRSAAGRKSDAERLIRILLGNELADVEFPRSEEHTSE